MDAKLTRSEPVAVNFVCLLDRVRGAQIFGLNIISGCVWECVSR